MWGSVIDHSLRELRALARDARRDQKCYCSSALCHGRPGRLPSARVTTKRYLRLGFSAQQQQSQMSSYSWATTSTMT